MSTAELLRIAQEALAAQTVSSDEFVEKVGIYSGAFETWSAAHSEVLSGKQKPDNEKEFRELADAHAKIMEHVAVLKTQTSKNLGELHKKGKGIMAYTDILPKRISISGTRKG